MKLSKLQKYILEKAWQSKKRKVSRHNFHSFYSQKKKNPLKSLQIKIITKSIERLIGRGLLIGFGEKTQYKLFIKKVKLTLLGKKVIKKILGEQIKLPFKNK